MALTAKQEGAVIDHIVNGMTKSDAYRKNYDTENMLSKSVNEKASELFANVKVAAKSARATGREQKALRSHRGQSG